MCEFSTDGYHFSIVPAGTCIEGILVSSLHFDGKRAKHKFVGKYTNLRVCPGSYLTAARTRILMFGSLAWLLVPMERAQSRNQNGSTDRCRAGFYFSEGKSSGKLSTLVVFRREAKLVSVRRKPPFRRLLPVTYTDRKTFTASTDISFRLAPIRFCR